MRMTARKPKREFSKDFITNLAKKSLSKREMLITMSLPLKGTHGYKVLNYWLNEYDVDTTHFLGMARASIENFNKKISLNEILQGDHPLYNTGHLKTRLFKEGILTRQCSKCLLTEWNDLPIPLDLDHINGKSWDHRLENIRMLCRNCHAQTDNFCGKNINMPKKAPKHRPMAELKSKYVAAQQHLIPLVLAANIDFTSYGWVSQVAPIIGQHHQKVREWMRKVMPETYETAYLRPRPGSVSEESPTERNRRYKKNMLARKMNLSSS